MTKTIFRSIVLIATAVLLLSMSIVTAMMYGEFEQTQNERLKAELTLAVQGVEYGGEDYLLSLDSENCRLTWVAADGTVLYDSTADAATMDNHLAREEISQAIANGYGESERYSETLTQKMLYCAALLDDGTVLRVAIGVDSVLSLLRDVLMPMALILICAVVVAALGARRMAKRIVEPLDRLDLDHPTRNDTYEELTPILRKLGNQRREIKDQIIQLRRKADEFEQITASMNEGLVLLDEHGTVLSMNTAAMQIFSVSDEHIGCDFLTIDRSPDMSHAVGEALSGKHSSFHAGKNGKEYQFIINRIESDSKILGAVILGFDITEKAFAERNRREFTANVSHELKTPLQSIIGSAELLESGLVKPEDTSRFIGNIKNEASRLVNLINDIIRLSQLDEDNDPATETVDLHEVAREVTELLTLSASKKHVNLILEGEPCTVCGVRRYLFEILYNLCDNAIRYNVEGGTVTVHLARQNDHTVISVSDTGIGIAPEHHDRIFERFYRVDKSHSKATGGTGLGLSIVKHAAMYHGGKVELTSEVGKGTTVRVVL